MLISLIAGFAPTMITYYKAIIFSIFLHKYFLFFEITMLFVPVSNAVFKLGLPVVALLGYIAIFAGGAIEILIGELLYKKPLSEFAFRGFFRDAK